jgi:zinc protease
MAARSVSSLPGPNDTRRHTLPNGLTILVRENFASPAVVINGYLEVGSQDELGGRHGLAGFTTDVMQRGTQRRSFHALYDEVESIGAGFGISSGTHLTSFGAKGLAEYLPVLLDILDDVLRSPSFPARQVEKVRTEILTDLQERAHDTRRLASLAFYELAYPEDHPYHWSQMGYPETIAAIDRDKLLSFYETFFSPEGMVIAVVGGIETEAAVEMIEQVFGDWRGQRPARRSLDRLPQLSESKERRLTVHDKTQSNVVMGWPGPARSHPDFIPCFVANTILGVFGMYGRLGLRVREQHGLASYVNSRLDGGCGAGPWRVVAGFDPQNVYRGIDLILDELRRLREMPVTEVELEDTMSYIVGSLPLYLETNEGVARSLVNIERYQLGMDYLRTYGTMIRSVTVEQVRDVARRWLDVDRYALAIAGPEVPIETVHQAPGIEGETP